MEAGSIWIRLGLNSDELRFGLDKAKYGMMEWRGELNQSTSDMTKWATALAVPVAAATAMIAITNDLIQTAERYQDQIEQFSLVTGMNTDATQKWRAAAIATDTDFGSLTMSLQYMNARITDNSTAGDELRSTLDSLGVQYKDTNGAYVNSDTLLKNIMSSMSNLSTAQERDAAANAIFGRSWYNLAEMINNSETALAAYKAASPAISEDDLKKVDEFKVKWAQVADQFDIVKSKAGIAVIDILSAISQAGAVTGVKVSSAGIGVVGAADLLTTGNAAKLDEATKRLLNPEAYTAEALAEQAAQYAATQAKQRKPGEPTEFTDKYAGLTTKQLELLKVTNDLADAEKNRAAALTQVDYDKYSLQISTLTNKQKDLTAAIEESAKTLKDERVTAMVSAWKKYQDQIEKVAGETEKLDEINKNFGRELAILNPRDVSAARNLIIKHEFDVEDQIADITKSRAPVEAAATEFNAIKAGTPLENVPGTPQYTEAQAKVSGPLPSTIVYHPPQARGEVQAKTLPILPAAVAASPAVLSTLVSEPRQEQTRETLRNIETPASIPVPLPVVLASEPKPAALSPISFSQTREDIDRIRASLPTPYLSQPIKERSQEPLPGISAAQQTMIKSGDLIINIDGKRLAKVPGVISSNGLTVEQLTARGIRVD